MSDYMEMIYPATRTCRVMKNGVTVAEYKVEQCDKCASWSKLDEFGYQKGYGGEKILWFCGGCR